MQRVRLMALGGLDEEGKNMYIVELDEDIFVIETGLKYPSETEQLGIEYIIPDFTYLLENKERVKAVFVTHGHDDVMSALAHLLKEIDVDVYATALTAKILEEQFRDYKLKNKKVKVIKRLDHFRVAGHVIHSFPLMMSIADGIGLAFDTDAGLIVYAGEFIFDYDFMNKAFSMDISALTEISKKDVLCLMAESGSASKNGYTTPKHRISEYIESYFESEGRIILTSYKQNLFRIIEVLEMAKKYKRRVFFYDEDHIKLLRIVESLGYYRIPKDIIISRKEFKNDMKNSVVVVSGGGDSVFMLLNKIALGEDNIVELNEEDTVIIASPVVAGTEKKASAMENDLYKAGVKVIKLPSRDVLSMHASSEDLKMMLHLVRPKYYLPIRGEYAALINNADIATEMGYTPDRIIVLDNGQFATFEKGRLISTRDTMELNDRSIDASDRRDVSGMVLKDRETLSTDGAIVVGVVLDFNTKKVIGGPDVQSRGVIYLKDADHILQEIANILLDTIDTAVKERRYENMPIRMEAKEKISRYILKETGKKPMILPAIVEINLGEDNG